jgi:hypothetical protein
VVFLAPIFACPALTCHWRAGSAGQAFFAWYSWWRVIG